MIYLRVVSMQSVVKCIPIPDKNTPVNTNIYFMSEIKIGQ